MKNRLLTLSLLLAAATTACVGESGTHIGNPPLASVGFELRVTGGTDPAAPLAFADGNGTQFQLSSAQAYVRNIRLDLPAGTTCADVVDDTVGARCEASEGEPRIVIDGPLVVDLVAGTSTPSIESVRLPNLAYRRIDFRLDDGDPDDGLIGEGSALDDRSLVADAAFTYAGQATTLRLALEFNEDVRVDDVGGLSPQTGSDVLVLLDVTDWLSGLPVTSCLDSGDLEITGGVLLLDDDAGDDDCDDFDDFIKENIKGSGRAESDDDDDDDDDDDIDD
jgi:hypothetical protein